VLWGVVASWIPLSVPAMTGLAFGIAAYAGLRLAMNDRPGIESRT
jgi:hypothetical protein